MQFWPGKKKIKVNITKVIITSKSQQQTIEDDFRMLKILKISDMIKIELAKFGLEITKRAQPQPVQSMMDAHGGKKLHRYPTRERTPLTYKNTEVSNSIEAFFANCLLNLTNCQVI